MHPSTHTHTFNRAVVPKVPNGLLQPPKVIRCRISTLPQTYRIQHSGDGSGQSVCNKLSRLVTVESHC